MKTDERTAKAVIDAKKPQDDTITFSTGVVLRGKQVPPILLIQVMASFPRPKPPVLFMENMGREMENALDPDYLERVRQWKVESGNVTLNIMIMEGTELVNKPKKLPGPEGDEWLNKYRLYGLPMFPEIPEWRYMAWVTSVAMITEDDINLLKKVVGRLSGVREADVAAAESFPGSDQADRG